ncbi:hypothetical protein AMATHDRAFT_75100 [Amanita thiersii Skay4041]|uniref:Peptidase M43 pregnancy-associated plasma-A domain-containing protein n=1 Tax=Amanita thiersii Skay4041 TaxID=703135 RepID=A0A2A9NU78_9AGAR|nr:hypothetical protein AMATHDRAFT_75100 [Amanita thiersii Skay4041]
MSFDVHIHVVYGDKSNTIGGYLSDKDIHAQMRVLNEGFASVGVSWNLVNISRVHQLDWFLNIGIDIFGAMKTSLRQGGASTLNIYTVSFYNTARTPHRGMLGYSTIPRDYAIAPALDGVVISYTVFPGGTQKSYHLGHTLTHEAGHWLGLYHTFQGGCSGSEGVSETGGDQVDDTPPQRNSTEGCPIFRDTCRGGGLDAIDNFMDYSPDECRNNFTPGQGTRMLQQAQVYRGK